MLRRVNTVIKTKVTRGHSSQPAVKEAGKAILQILRFDPIANVKRIETYEYDKKQDFMVLDLLTAVKAHQDPSLAFRASCCEGVCGSCAMNINGINSLACVTFAQHVTTVGPLPNFPVIKDLVVDLRGFFRQYEYIRPYVRNVNLQRCHIDGVYQRYTSACKEVLGGNPEKTREMLLTASTPQDTKITALLKLLDAAVTAGSATQAVLVLAKLKDSGMVFDSLRVKDLLNETLANNAKQE